MTSPKTLLGRTPGRTRDERRERSTVTCGRPGPSDQLASAAGTADDFNNLLTAILGPVVLDLNGTVAATAPLLERLIGANIRIKLRLQHGLAAVRIDPVQVEQVLMNLVINARDAMPGGGEVSIETANVDLDEHYARTHFAVVPGSYVMMAVSDSGIGMPPEVQSRILEPFFTTKLRSFGSRKHQPARPSAELSWSSRTTRRSWRSSRAFL